MRASKFPAAIPELVVLGTKKGSGGGPTAEAPSFRQAARASPATSRVRRRERPTGSGLVRRPEERERGRAHVHVRVDAVGDAGARARDQERVRLVDGVLGGR